MGLEVLDDVFGLSVGDDILEADEIVMLAAICSADNRQERVALGFIRLSVGAALGRVRISSSMWSWAPVIPLFLHTILWCPES